MLRPYGRLHPAVGANVHVRAELDLPRGDLRFGMKSEALPIDDEAHVRADLAASPQVKRFIDDQIADAVVALYQRGYFGGGFSGGDVLFCLRGA